MRAGRPRISVVVPAYNSAPYLAEALDSVCAQTFQDWVCTIVDDGSTDDTGRIASVYACRDSRFRIVQQSNHGLSHARNVAMRRSPGDFYAFLDSDDVWAPDKLAAQLEKAQEGVADFIFCAYRRFGLQSPLHSAKQVRPGLMEPKEFRLRMAEGCFTMPSCVMISARVVEALGGFDEDLSAAEDWDFWLRMGKAGFAAYALSEPLCNYRVHPQSHSTNWHLAYWQTSKVLDRHFSGTDFPPRLNIDARRLFFRNAFTYLGDQGQFQLVMTIFDHYRFCDIDGYACRVMRVTRRMLPIKVFWFVSRYFLIPLAWHLEALGERLSRRFSPPRAGAENE